MIRTAWASALAILRSWWHVIAGWFIILTTLWVGCYLLVQLPSWTMLPMTVTMLLGTTCGGLLVGKNTNWTKEF